MDRYKIREMMCMQCFEVQPIGKYCATCKNPDWKPVDQQIVVQESDENPVADIPKDIKPTKKAGPFIEMGSYYCDACHLFSSDPKKKIYHCDGCNMCRVGNSFLFRGELKFYRLEKRLDSLQKLRHLCAQIDLRRS